MDKVFEIHLPMLQDAADNYFVLEMCRSLITRKRLDWHLTDVERVINGIVGDV